MTARTNLFGVHYTLADVGGERTEISLDVEKKHIIVNHPLDAILQGWYDWQMRGLHIQEAFSFLNPDEREFLLTGMTSEEWAELFGETE